MSHKIPLRYKYADVFALVSNVDYKKLSKYMWFALWDDETKSFYALRRKKLKSGKIITILMHRQILGLLKGDERQADHINHDTTDNRRPNLRIVTTQQNAFNRRNVKGYYLCKRTQKYIAQIKIKGTSTHIGIFDTAKEAQAAYIEAKKNLINKMGWCDRAELWQL